MKKQRKQVPEKVFVDGLEGETDNELLLESILDDDVPVESEVEPLGETEEMEDDIVNETIKAVGKLLHFSQSI